MIFTLLVLGELTFLLLSSYAVCYIFAFAPVLFSFSNISTVHFCAALVLLLLYSFCHFCEWNIFPFISAVVYFFWPCCVACGIFIPWPGVEPTRPTTATQSPNHWTAREVPENAIISAEKSYWIRSVYFEPNRYILSVSLLIIFTIPLTTLGWRLF